MKKCIIKRAIKTNSTIILWEALYYNNIKQIEDYKLDIPKCLAIFSDISDHDIIEIYDTDIDYNIEDSFPHEEDFSYLLDFNIIEPMMFVYLRDGEYIINNIWDSYRPSGYYTITEWDTTIYGEIIPVEIEYFFEGHDVKMFTVVGKEDEEFVWEDFNYQQSFLYTYSNQKK